MKKTVKIISWITFFVLTPIIHRIMMQSEKAKDVAEQEHPMLIFLISVLVTGLIVRFIVFTFLKRALYPKSELSNLNCVWCGKEMDKRFGKYCSKKCAKEHEDSGTKKQPFYKDVLKH